MQGRSGGLLRALQRPEVEIAPVFRKQFAVRAGFHHSAPFQHQDPVGVLHGGQAMGDRDHGCLLYTSDAADEP